METTLSRIIQDIQAFKRARLDTNGIFVLVTPNVWTVLLNDPSHISFINVDIQGRAKRTICGCRCVITDDVDYYAVTTTGEVI